jgi:hypothetical protein
MVTTMVTKTHQEAPEYVAHVESCPLCFRDGGSYPFEPCPEGKRIMWSSTDEGGDRG